MRPLKKYNGSSAGAIVLWKSRSVHHKPSVSASLLLLACKLLCMLDVSLLLLLLWLSVCGCGVELVTEVLDMQSSCCSKFNCCSSSFVSRSLCCSTDAAPVWAALQCRRIDSTCNRYRHVCLQCMSYSRRRAMGTYIQAMQSENCTGKTELGCRSLHSIAGLTTKRAYLTSGSQQRVLKVQLRTLLL